MIEKLSVGKTLELDGFTSVFYKVFKSILVSRLHKVFIKAFEAKKLPPSRLEACVTLIPRRIKMYCSLSPIGPYLC